VLLDPGNGMLLSALPDPDLFDEEEKIMIVE